MKKGLFVLIVGIIGFVVFSYVFQEHAEQAIWLHGNWQLAYDPDGDDKDYMEFLSDGRVHLKSSPTKAYATCDYASKIGHVTIQCMIKGVERGLSLEVSPDKQRLTNSSGAYYKKM